jgi:hypothetical protein
MEQFFLQTFKSEQVDAISKKKKEQVDAQRSWENRKV